MAGNRPRSREKHVTGGSKGVKRRGSGLGSGTVGGGSSVSGGSSMSGSSMSSSSYGSSSSGRRVTRAGGGKSPLMLIIIVAVLLLGGGGSLSSLLPLLLGGGNSSYSDQSVIENMVANNIGNLTGNNNNTNQSNTSNAGDILSGFSSLLNSGSSSSGWELGANTGKLDKTVDSEARDKRTQIKGKGKDEVTIMVYMCGTDLESRSGMGTSDLQEMLNADLGDKVNLIVYTGGCKGWKNNVVSNSVNQIYQIRMEKCSF